MRSRFLKPLRPLSAAKRLAALVLFLALSPAVLAAQGTGTGEGGPVLCASNEELATDCCTGELVCVPIGTIPPSCAVCPGPGCTVCVTIETTCGPLPCGFTAPPEDIGELITFRAEVVEWFPGLSYGWTIHEGNVSVIGDLNSETLRVLTLGEGLVRVSVRILGHPCQAVCGDCTYIEGEVEVVSNAGCNIIDCNANGVEDSIDIESGSSRDCNLNGNPDECDIADGTSEDMDIDGIPDECECGCMDLVFVLDDTFSMGGALDNVAQDVVSLITLAQSRAGDDLRLGLVTFKDEVTVHSPLTTDLDSVRAAIQSLTPEGGNLLPEASDEALREVIEQSSDCVVRKEFDTRFRPECYKFAILVTDAVPGACTEDEAEGAAGAAAIAQLAAAGNVEVSAIQVGLDGPGELTAIMANYANATGGIHAIVPSDGAGTADAVRDILTSCRDCNANGQLDATDILLGLSLDLDGDGIPDECQYCPGDANLDGAVDVADMLLVLSSYGPCPGCAADLNFDGVVDISDLLVVLGGWGPCPEPPGLCDPEYIPMPGDPIPELYCDDTYRTLVLERIAPSIQPTVFTALTLLDEADRIPAFTDSTYIEIRNHDAPELWVFLEDSEGPLVLWFDPPVLPDQGIPALLARIAADNEGSSEVVVGFLVDSVIAAFAQVFDLVGYLQVSYKVGLAIETVTNPCHHKATLEAFADMFDPQAGFCAIGCNEFVGLFTTPFGFGAAGDAANLVRVFFYYECISLCIDLTNHLDSTELSRLRAAVLTVSNTLQCP